MKRSLCTGSFPFPCCFSFPGGRAYGFAPIRGILLPAIEDGCRSSDFGNGAGCVGESDPCSSGIVQGSLASTPGRTENVGILLGLEGLEISESEADREKGLARGFLENRGSSDPLRTFPAEAGAVGPETPDEGIAARFVVSDGGHRTGLRARSSGVSRVKTGSPNMPVDGPEELTFLGDAEPCAIASLIGILRAGVRLGSRSVLLKADLFGDPAFAMWLRQGLRSGGGRWTL
ncbi:hypothetical protein BJV78DRAFT_299160 [Lactifluus subvellereus]|nr:hypothetical protein BJV78DRAFT_299160 [Lactifluus subvellereus]